MSSQHVLENAFYRIEFAQPKRARDRREENAMYCTARQKIALQNGSAEHVQVPKNSDLSNLACRGTLDQPRSANRDVRITPNEAPQCRSQNSGFKCLSVSTKLFKRTADSYQHAPLQDVSTTTTKQK